MEIIDLKLVPVNELIKEIENRCTEFVCSYRLISADRDPNLCGATSFFGKGDWVMSMGMVSILNNDIANNWEKGE